MPLFKSVTRVCEEKSVIKIFYDNDWGWKLVPELSTLVLYITGLSGHVKNRRDFPPVLLELYGLFWQPSLVHDAQFPINLTPVTDRHRPLFRSLKGGQIQGFEQRSIAWKYTPLAVQLPVSGIQTLNGIGGINDLTYLGRKLEDRRNSVPVLPPAFHGIRILLTPFFCDTL